MKAEHTTKYLHMVDFEVMPHEMSNIADDGTTSKSRCKERAERQLRKAYSEAVCFLGTGEGGMSAFVLGRLKEYLTEQFYQVRHLLRLMSGMSGIQDELGKIEELTDFTRIENKAHAALEKNVGSEHKLSEFSDYADEIEYLDDDMEMEEGFLRVLEKAFVHYNFDGSQAYFKIREDTQGCYDTYRDEVDCLCRSCCLPPTAAGCGDIWRRLRSNWEWGKQQGKGNCLYLFHRNVQSIVSA